MIELSLKAAREIAGSLGNPSKMPGASYGLPISACNVGARLRAQGPGENKAGYANPCGSCYAAEGFYRTFAKTVVPSQERRLRAIQDPLWVDAMVVQIRASVHKNGPWFRWHDSGDLQGMDHLSKIVEIARALPDIHFWLPTREAKLDRDWLAANGSYPPNLTVRVSAMATPSARSLAAGRVFSTVSGGDSPPEGAHRCAASMPDTPTHCGDCRACWDTSIPWIDYHTHTPQTSSVAKRAARK